MIILSHKRQDTIVMMIPCLCSFRSSSCDLRHKKIPRPNGLVASFLVDIPTRWEPRTNQSPARALIAPPAARPCCSSPVPSTTKKSPDRMVRGSWWSILHSTRTFMQASRCCVRYASSQETARHQRVSTPAHEPFELILMQGNSFYEEPVF